MKTSTFCLLLLCFTFLTSCDDVDDRVIEIVGVYDSNIIGVTDFFSMSISALGNDDLLIEAPFDGDVWVVIDVDVDDKDGLVKDIDIHRQDLGGGVSIWGDGFYTEGTIQLDYTMQFGNDRIDFTLIGQK